MKTGPTSFQTPILDRATALGRVLFSSDEDLIVEARRRQREGTDFAGVIFAPQAHPIGACIDALELVSKAGEPEDFAGSLMLFRRGPRPLLHDTSPRLRLGLLVPSSPTNFTMTGACSSP